MSEASGLSENLRTLADFVDRLEDAAKIDVEDARFLDPDGEDDLRASLTVRVPIAPATEDVVNLAEVHGEKDVQVDVDVDEDEDEEDTDDGPTDDAVCDVEGCDYSGSTRGLAIHQARAHDGGDDNSVEAELAEILEKNGELPSKEIGLVLESSSSHYRNVLAKMARDGRVESRRDPDDGRRRLYRLADDDVQDEHHDDRVDEDSDHSIEDDELSEAPDVDLEESVADDSPEGTGDDVHDEIVVDDEEKPTVDAVDYDEDTEIDLPDGVSAEDVDEATRGGIKLGDLAEDLGVHPNRARAIAFDLDLYTRVREVKYRGGV